MVHGCGYSAMLVLRSGNSKFFAVNTQQATEFHLILREYATFLVSAFYIAA